MVTHQLCVHILMEHPIGKYSTLVISAPSLFSVDMVITGAHGTSEVQRPHPTDLDYSSGRKKSLFVSEGREQQVAGKVLSALRGQVTSQAELQARMTWAVAWELLSVAGCSETRPLCPT